MGLSFDRAVLPNLNNAPQLGIKVARDDVSSMLILVKKKKTRKNEQRHAIACMPPIRPLQKLL